MTVFAVGLEGLDGLYSVAFNERAFDRAQRHVLDLLAKLVYVVLSVAALTRNEVVLKVEELVEALPSDYYLRELVRLRISIELKQSVASAEVEPELWLPRESFVFLAGLDIQREIADETAIIDSAVLLVFLDKLWKLFGDRA